MATSQVKLVQNHIPAESIGNGHLNLKQLTIFSKGQNRTAITKPETEAISQFYLRRVEAIQGVGRQRTI